MKQIITAKTVLSGAELEEIHNGAVVIEDGKIRQGGPRERPDRGG